MKKGISPVIAVVLLIAIAVIAAVGVWYWAAGLADKPPGAETAQTAFTVGECNLNEAETPSNASARIVNTGGVNIGSDRMVTVYSEGEHRGNISFDLGLEAGEEAYVDLVSTDEDHFTSGTQYTVVDGDFPDITFHCN